MPISLPQLYDQVNDQDTDIGRCLLWLVSVRRVGRSPNAVNGLPHSRQRRVMHDLWAVGGRSATPHRYFPPSSPSQARGVELLPRSYRDAVINGLHTRNSTGDFHGTFHMLVFMSEAAENHHAGKSFDIDLHVAEWEFFGKRRNDGSSDCKVAASC